MGCAVFPCIFATMQLDDLNGKRILISPLNWGFGHVSRCIGIVHRLLGKENTVVIACDAEQEAIFREYFPDLDYVRHEGYPFSFGGKGHFALDLFKRYFALRKRLRLESIEAGKLVKEFRIDVILSDHRYGFVVKGIPSVFITHQLNLPLKWYQAPVAVRHNKFIQKFKHIWVLDTPEFKYAGRLSATFTNAKAIYIGPVSRFECYDEVPDKTYKTVAVVSGPAVYAQQFADWIAQKHPSALVICHESIELPVSMPRLSGTWREQDQAILRAQEIISRSGYSTIMDLAHLGVRGTYEPTPGQAEQLYLKEWLKDCSECRP